MDRSFIVKHVAPEIIQENRFIPVSSTRPIPSIVNFSVCRTYLWVISRTDSFLSVWNEDVEAIATNVASGSSSPRWMPSAAAEPPEETPVAASRKRQRAQTPLTPTHSPEYPGSGDQEFDPGSSKHSLLKRVKVHDNESTALGSVHRFTRQNIPSLDAEVSVIIKGQGNSQSQCVVFISCVFLLGKSVLVIKF